MLILGCFYLGTTLADELRDQIASFSCSVLESETKTFEKDTTGLKKYNWLGSPKQGNVVNLVIKKVPSDGIRFGFDSFPMPLIFLTHHLHPENSKTDGVNWVESNDDVLNQTNLRIHRTGLRVKNKISRGFVDLRHRSGNNWDGFILNDISGDPDYNSLQLMSLNCKLSKDGWLKAFDAIMSIAKNK